MYLYSMLNYFAQNRGNTQSSHNRPPLIVLERQAKTEYKAREYLSDGKKAPGAYEKGSLFHRTSEINKSLEWSVSANDLAGYELRARTRYCKPIQMPHLRANSPFVMTKVSREEKGIPINDQPYQIRFPSERSQ